MEWGSSWQAVPQAGTSDRDGGGGGSGGGDDDDGSRCYELYYTVPDELRRPWQVRSSQAHAHRPSRTLSACDVIMYVVMQLPHSLRVGWVESCFSSIVKPRPPRPLFVYTHTHTHQHTVLPPRLIGSTGRTTTGDSGGGNRGRRRCVRGLFRQP